MKVLLADDSGVMRKIIRRLLEDVGVLSATEASDGDQAVALFKAGHFELVLTDWNMPNKSGLEVVREIRALGSTVPIIMITTEAEKERIADAIFAGATDYLVKPFDQDKLRAMLNNHLAAKSNVSSDGGWHPQFVPQATPKESWGKRIS
ncbi:MAG: response regulator [Planctomycetaceae bacterium]|nr:response regulator [Planctomycetaceae bacterium]